MGRVGQQDAAYVNVYIESLGSRSCQGQATPMFDSVNAIERKITKDGLSTEGIVYSIIRKWNK